MRGTLGSARSALILLALAAVTAALSLSGVLGSLLLPRPRPPAPPAPAALVSPPPAPVTLEVMVRPGDTLVSALGREGVADRASADLATAFARAGAQLRRLRPGQSLAVTWGPDHAPLGVTWHASPWLDYAATASDEGWRVRRVDRPPDVRVAVVSGEVTRSLFDAVEDAGESAALVQDLVEIFASDFDFAADTQVGDRFRLLVEKRYADSTFVDYGRVLAAQYTSAGRVLTGVGWQLREGASWQFFDRRGRSLKKTFLKSPLEFTRVTSGFSYARPHPILGGVRPHLAVDYAAPAGTPVRAVADAIVARAGWDGGNGISVLLRHRAAYDTMYNHLSGVAPGVHAGARVRQRQVIGYVGATGLATGPHLDFRVVRGGQLVNPLKERFLPGEPLAGAARAEFARHATEVVHELESAAPFPSDVAGRSE